MRKPGGKAAVFGLLFCTLLSITGCGGVTPKKLLDEAAKNMQKVRSSANQVEVAIQLEDILELKEVNLDMTMENTTEPPAGHAKGTAKVNIRDAELEAELEIYQVTEEGSGVTYSAMDGQWERSEDGEDAEDHLGVDGNIFAQGEQAMEDFHLSGESVTVEGKECYQMYGDVTGEELMGLLGKDMVSAFGLVELPDEQAVRELKIPVIFDIYKEERLPARIIVDMSQVMNDLYDSIGETTKVNLYSIELVFTDYDGVSKIEVPAEVKGSAERKG